MNLRKLRDSCWSDCQYAENMHFRWENAYFLHIWGQANACTCKKGAEVPSLALHTQKICIFPRENAYFLHIGYLGKMHISWMLAITPQKKQSFSSFALHTQKICIFPRENAYVLHIGYLGKMHISCILAITPQNKTKFL